MSIYWGAMLQGAAPPYPSGFQPGGIYDQFQTAAGKAMSVTSFGNAWYRNGVAQTFELPCYTTSRAQGAIPMVNWSAWELAGGAPTTQPNFTNAQITSGRYDSYITQWALAAKAWGHPFFLRYNDEMNAWWYPWAEGHNSSGVVANGNAAGSYITAWRHVHDIFTANGVTNVTWIWCPNYADTSSNYVTMASVYPGDAYVDWLGITVYNKGGGFSSLTNRLTGIGGGGFSNSYASVCAIHPTKPIFVGEIGCVEGGDDGTMKQNWFTSAFTTELQNTFPRIRGLAYYNWQDSTPPPLTFPITTTPKAQQGFHDAIATNPYYVANTYGTITQTPIPPPIDLTAYKTAVLATTGIRNYYRLGDVAGSTTAVDTVGTLTGTNAAGVTAGVGGAIFGDSDTAYTFSGTSTGKVTTAATTLPTAWTIELWCKRSRLLTQEFLISHGNTTAVLDTILGIGFDGADKLFFGFISDDFTTAAAYATDTTTWHQFVCTYDSATKVQQMYWDGAFIQSRTSTGVYTNPSTPFQLGQRLNAANTAPFAGQMDDVSVYTGVLVAATILSHYQIGSRPPVAPGIPTGLASSAITATGATLTWVAADTLATAFILERLTSGVWAVVYSGTALTFADTGLTGATAYQYRVSAQNGTGTSATSTPLTVTTSAPVLSYTATVQATGGLVDYWRLGEAAAATTALDSLSVATGALLYKLTALTPLGETTASAASASVTGSSATVTWTAITGATGYNIYGRGVAGIYGLITSVGVVTSWVDTGSLVSNGAVLPPIVNTALIAAPGPVTAVASGTGGTLGTAIVPGSTRYNVTRDLDGTGANAWPQGAVWADLGVAGDGRIELNAYATPRISLLTQGATYNAQKEVVRIGDLNAGWDYTVPTYGMAIGSQYQSDNITGATWLAIDPTFGFRLQNGTTNIASLNPTGDFRIGQQTQGHITLLSSGDLQIASNQTLRMLLSAAGTFTIYNNSASPVITLDNVGNSFFAGAMSIGQFGGIWQGTGTFVAPTDGLKLYSRNGVGRFVGFGGAQEQIVIDTDGKLKAGAGKVILDVSGIGITVPNTSYTWQLNRAVNFYNETTGVLAASVSAGSADYNPGGFHYGQLSLEGWGRPSGGNGALNGSVYLCAYDYGNASGAIIQMTGTYSGATNNLISAQTTKFQVLATGTNRFEVDSAGIHTGAAASNPSWLLGAYTAGAPTATGYATVTINGVAYKVIVST